ncbi:hypothetical protein OUHCRE4_32810 [Enterobacter hormaechei subsp. steigerwaltii]
MLEDVGVQFALVGGIVGQQRAAKAHQLNIQTVFLLCHLFGDFRHVLLSAINHADFNVSGIIAALVTAREQQASQEKRTQSKFHETVPFDRRFEDYIDNETAG